MKGLLAALASDIFMYAGQLIEYALKDGEPVLDARGIPAAMCPVCGCEWYVVEAMFDETSYELSAYMLDAVCGDCGTLVTAPTPEDVIITDGQV